MNQAAKLYDKLDHSDWLVQLSIQTFFCVISHLIYLAAVKVHSLKLLFMVIFNFMIYSLNFVTMYHIRLLSLLILLYQNRSLIPCLQIR